MYNKLSFMSAVTFGQPNFWQPRFPSPLLLKDMPTEQASYCNTAPMLDTLQRLADFQLINSKSVRLSLGATRVTTGDLVFFDNQQQQIGPEHVLASGSLPPGFPATEVEGELYWDGGCVSNTPLDAIYEGDEDGHTLVFMIDLWDAHGKAPRNMDEVSWRQKQIQYASRTSHHIDKLASLHNHRRALHHVTRQNKADVSAVSDDLLLDSHNGEATYDIVHLIYQPAADQISDSDAEFSRSSILERSAAGYADMQRVLKAKPWASHARPAHMGSSVHTVRGERISSSNPA
ncbi:patatin-like phospholipase family protein [Chitinilyticum litopenaei]|uniref:patatin-like phospholipase family protein n=1 Tax=Chitinilyticum litopenaei TaxID=1121276 RepID=UPI000424C2C1|nr:DUF3734 domain-containing protein [Chitinilyticum litopenaei]